MHIYAAFAWWIKEWISFNSIKLPHLGWLYFFSSFPHPEKLLISKWFELNLRYLGQRKYIPGEMYWMTFLWPWPKAMAVVLMNKHLLVCTIKWEPLIQSLRDLNSCIHLVMLITWINFGRILLGTFFLVIFFQNFKCVFYPSALRAGGVSSSRFRRAGGRVPNLRNPYLCNRLADFLHSKFCGIV